MWVCRALLVLLLAASISSSATAQDRPKIVVVNYALQYLTERLVEGDADVVFPVPGDVDPSFWRPSISDISAVQSADLILLSGAGFATWVDRVSLPRSRLVNTSALIKDQFIVTESITHSHGDGGEHSHEGLASYIWLDPSLAAAQAEAIAAALAGRDLVEADVVYSRLTELKSDLADIDETAREALNRAKGVWLIATHPRYQYFARRYDLQITSLEWEAGAVPTQAQLDELAVLATNSTAKILIWEAEPPSVAIDMVSNLGLQNVIFPPLAQPVAGMDWDRAFIDAVANIASAVDGSETN